MLLTDNYNNLNNEVELLLTQKDKTIKIEEKLTSMISLKGNLNLTLYVPKSYTGNLLLRNVSRNINSEESISNIKTFTANTVSGEIRLISVNAEMFL